MELGHCRGGGIHGEDLFARIISPENLFLAWREFRRGKRSKLDIQQFEFAREDNIFQLHDELVRKTYRHDSYVPFSINDPKPRRIHKATVRDRLVHHAVFRVLYPIFDRSFIFDSYSCRIGKGTHRAVKRLEQFTRSMSGNNRKNIWALKCDVRRFFDSIDHVVLLRLIQRKISDEHVLWLIGLILGSFEKASGVGLPLGNVTSQLFANIYLNELDRFVKHELRTLFYMRYCDDFLLLGDNQKHLLRVKDAIAGFLQQELRLLLHPNKVTIRSYRQGIDFVGYVVRPHCIILRTKTKQRMLKRITSENQSSYLGVLRHCNSYNLVEILERMVG